MISFLNMIPIYPLDGGRILRGILFLKVGYKKSIKISTSIAKWLMVFVTLIGILLFIYLKNFSLLTLSVYVYLIIKEEEKKDRIQLIINELIGIN